MSSARATAPPSPIFDVMYVAIVAASSGSKKKFALVRVRV
jgi:hypothetical protein